MSGAVVVRYHEDAADVAEDACIDQKECVPSVHAAYVQKCKTQQDGDLSCLY